MAEYGIESELQTTIREIDYKHRFGPLRWGRVIKDYIVIPEGWTGIEFKEVDLLGLRLMAIIERSWPDSILLYESNQIGEFFKRRLIGNEINVDYTTRSRFFYQR